MEKSTNFYKACNYLIQGTCADGLKEAEIELQEYLKDKKSRFILPIHDEIAVEVHPDEESYVPKKLKEIMEDIQTKMFDAARMGRYSIIVEIFIFSFFCFFINIIHVKHFITPNIRYSY